MIILKQQYYLIWKKITIDKEGRFIVREQLPKFSKISKEIIFIGKGNHFEIWEKNFEKSIRKFQEQNLNDK